MLRRSASTALPSIALLALALTAGCKEEPPPAPGDLAIELGTGSWRFEPLVDEQDVELVRGAQGGWHVWVSVRAEGLRGDPPIATLYIESEVLDLDGVPPSVTEARVAFTPRQDEPGVAEVVGWIHVQNAPACVVDRRIRLRVAVTDEESGRTALDERIVVPRSTPETRPPVPCIYE